VGWNVLQWWPRACCAPHSIMARTLSSGFMCCEDMNQRGS
jgi:hypothetical protein